MAVTVGVNSWVTLAQADEYFATRLGSSSWFALPPTGINGADSKEALLVTAFNWILYDGKYSVSESTDSANVRMAQLEAAIFLLEYREEYESRAANIAGGVQSISASKWSETLGEVTMPARVAAALLRAGASSLGGAFVDLEQ